MPPGTLHSVRPSDRCEVGVGVLDPAMDPTPGEPEEREWAASNGRSGSAKVGLAAAVSKGEIYEQARGD